MDISGEAQRDISHNIYKIRLDEKGTAIPNSRTVELRNDLDRINDRKQSSYCGSCYGGMEPENGCCNSCEDVRQAYVNRGWSFSNPDAIEQVRSLFVLLHAYFQHHCSVSMKAGQTNFENNPMKAATSRVTSA
jgi:hypothetical protein